ncbi:MAG: hypothetical protein ACYCS7_09285 [Acidimicrobiales bacterium]
MDDDGLNQPPADAQDWSDEEWLEWLVATDQVPAAEAGEGPWAPKVHSVPTRMLGAAMTAMHDAIYGPVRRDEVVMEAPSGPPGGPEDVEVHLDAEHPEQSRAVVHRPRGSPDSSP